MQAHQLAASCIIKLCAHFCTCGRGGTPGGAAGCPSGTESASACRRRPASVRSVAREPDPGSARARIQRHAGRSDTSPASPLPRVIQNDRAQAELVVGFDRHYRAGSMRGSCSRDARWPASTADCCRASKEIRGSATIRPRHLGIETRYGRVKGNTPVFQALATLAEAAPLRFLSR